MPQSLSDIHFRPTVSRSDWLVVLAALAAYSHNDEYRKVHSRLSQEAYKAGILSLPILLTAL